SLAAFRKGLAEIGFVEGHNVTMDIRWMNNDFSRLPELNADLIRGRPAVLFTGTPPGVRAAMAATKSIPIVFNIGEDPVKEGLVASLNRPGGNVTGFGSSSGRVCRPHSQGREAGRPAGAANHKARIHNQPQNYEGARPQRASDAARPCRRGDRVIRRREFITL